jgi:hypothetical protein
MNNENTRMITNPFGTLIIFLLLLVLKASIVYAIKTIEKHITNHWCGRKKPRRTVQSFGGSRQNIAEVMKGIYQTINNAK